MRDSAVGQPECDEFDAPPVLAVEMDAQPALELFSARAAALKLGYARRTASIRAQRAHAAGDPGVRKTDNNVWLATLPWWEKLLEDPPRRGYRPIRNRNSA